MQLTRLPGQASSLNRPCSSPKLPRPLLRCHAAADTARHVDTQVLRARELTPEAFSPFGQVVAPTSDGKAFDHEDAQLQGFDAGTPRFYIMRLPRRGLTFNRITYHHKVTQVLGSVGTPNPWYMVVAKPSGSVAKYPQESDMVAFRIPPGKAVKLHQGTWHAGPLFESEDYMDFYNLELSDTNIVDHNTHDFQKDNRLQFTVAEP